MTSVVPEFLDTSPFADEDLWELGWEENWKELKRILGPVTGDNFAVTELKHRLLIDDIRRRFDSSKDMDGYTILSKILLTNASDYIKMTEVAALVLTAGVHPDLPNTKGWRPAHLVGHGARVELVSTIFACRPDMAARNINKDTPSMAALKSTYVSMMQKTNTWPIPPPPPPTFQLDSDV
jgi:hypothetical protein